MIIKENSSKLCGVETVLEKQCSGKSEVNFPNISQIKFIAQTMCSCACDCRLRASSQIKNGATVIVRTKVAEETVEECFSSRMHNSNSDLSSSSIRRGSEDRHEMDPLRNSCTTLHRDTEYKSQSSEESVTVISCRKFSHQSDQERRPLPLNVSCTKKGS